MFHIETTPLGRVYVAERDPLFYTTRDIDGRLDSGTVTALTTFIAERFDLQTSLTTCNQIHGATVKPARKEPGWRECDACDALWSAERGVALGIKVADCLPVTIFGDGVVANIHSGWRGAVRKITSAALDGLQSGTRYDPSTARAYLGPSIRACCFEVGEEVVEQFTASYPDMAAYVDRSRAKPHVDLVALTSAVLRNRGFSAANVFDSGLCTRCEGSLFHSYRRQGSGGGRNLAIAAQ